MPTLEELTPRQRKLLGAYTLNTELGRGATRAERGLERNGVDAGELYGTLTSQQRDTLEKERLTRMAGRGAKGAQLAKIKGALSTEHELGGMIDEFTSTAKVQGIDEVRRAYGDAGNFLPAGMDPNSPAAMAVMGQLANERSQAVFQTAKGIEQQGLYAKTGLKKEVDLNVISGALEKIGDIVEMQKALAEAKDAARMAGYANLAGAVGGLAGFALGGPVGAGLGSAAGAGAVGGAGGVGGASTSLDALTKYLLAKYGSGTGTTPVPSGGGYPGYREPYQGEGYTA